MPDAYQNQSNEFQTLRPNKKKLILESISKTIGLVLLIFVVLFAINKQIGFEMLLVPFEVLNIEIKASSIFLTLIAFIVGFFMVSLMAKYLTSGIIRYEFYNDKIIFYEGVFLIFVKPKEIPYQNIVKVSYMNDGIFNKIFNYGTVTLDVTGMKDDKVRMNFVDNFEQVVKYIESMRRRFAYIQQAKFQEGYRISNIINKF